MIKRLKPDSKHELISTLDDAVSSEGTNVDMYRKTLDTAHLRILKDKHPTLFVVQPPSHDMKIAFEEEHVKVESVELRQPVAGAKAPDPQKPRVRFDNYQGMLLKYFNACVKGVKQWDEKKGAYVEEPVGSPDEFPYAVVQDVGGMCMALSSLGAPVKNA